MYVFIPMEVCVLDLYPILCIYVQALPVVEAFIDKGQVLEAHITTH